tara:strand:+ start:1338 stop:1820 length:483 start_codon:yes stop_codon:yes gene_type:complete
MKIKTNTILIFILLALFGSVMAAYIIEYGLGYKPCKLCIYQRIPYIISIIIILNFLFIKKYRKASLLVLSFISLFGSVLAFYHFGIEQGLFTESAVCDANPLTTDSLDKKDILKQLEQSTISCKDVDFTIFGFSLASINTIFSLILFVIFMKLYKNYETN